MRLGLEKTFKKEVEMPRSKKLDEVEKKKEQIRQLRKGPDLEKYLEGKKRKYTSYAEGARIFSMSYYTFISLAKAAGANMRIKKNVVVDLEAIEEYLEKLQAEVRAIDLYEKPFDKQALSDERLGIPEVDIEE